MAFVRYIKVKGKDLNKGLYISASQIIKQLHGHRNYTVSIDEANQRLILTRQEGEDEQFLKTAQSALAKRFSGVHFQTETPHQKEVNHQSDDYDLLKIRLETKEVELERQGELIAGLQSRLARTDNEKTALEERVKTAEARDQSTGYVTSLNDSDIAQVLANNERQSAEYQLKIAQATDINNSLIIQAFEQSWEALSRREYEPEEVKIAKHFLEDRDKFIRQYYIQTKDGKGILAHQILETLKQMGALKQEWLDADKIVADYGKLKIPIRYAQTGNNEVYLVVPVKAKDSGPVAAQIYKELQRFIVESRMRYRLSATELKDQAFFTVRLVGKNIDYESATQLLSGQLKTVVKDASLELDFFQTPYFQEIRAIIEEESKKEFLDRKFKELGCTTITDFKDKTGVDMSYATLCALFSGNQEPKRMKSRRELAKAFGVSVEEIESVFLK